MSATSSRIRSSTRRTARAKTMTTSGTLINPRGARLTEGRFSDYNYVRNDGKCEPAGPEPIPAGVCEHKTDTYLGSSGWRRIPGNTCDRDRGSKKDEKVQKSCEKGESSLIVAG